MFFQRYEIHLYEVTKQKNLLDAVLITNLAHKPSAHLGVFAKILQNIEKFLIKDFVLDFALARQCLNKFIIALAYSQNS